MSEPNLICRLPIGVGWELRVLAEPAKLNCVMIYILDYIPISYFVSFSLAKYQTFPQLN